jgi:hypothetical protein
MIRHSLIAALGITGSALSAYAEALATWSWENLKDNSSANAASYQSPGIHAQLLQPNDLTQEFSATGGDKDAYRSFYGWDEKSEYSVDSRSALTPYSRTLSFQVDWNSGTTVSLENLSLSLTRPDGKDSPNLAQASLFWVNADEKVEWASSGTVDLAGVGSSWSPTRFSFDNFSSPPVIPPNGKLLVEVYAWGGTNQGRLGVDNLQLNGSATTVVPEPGTALLLGVVSLGGLLRRRRSTQRTA